MPTTATPTTATPTPATPRIPAALPLDGAHHLRTTVKTARWGELPHAGSAPVLTVADGETLTVDLVSHEGILPDQGRDPVAFFGEFGVAERDVLPDAREIAESVLGRDQEVLPGPHIVTGPVAIRGAAPGDLLRVETLTLHRRAHYGIVANRHTRGALPNELPAGNTELTSADLLRGPTGTISAFCTVDDTGHGVLRCTDTLSARFPLSPFVGIMGVASGTEGTPLSSIPPGVHGGNLDIKHLTCGSSLYLPVRSEGAGFYAGDPHFAQGNGEVALTAFEAPLRATFRLSLIRGEAARRVQGLTGEPFAETPAHWIAIGLDADLDEAMRRCVRAALAFLTAATGMDRQTAYAYLSAAADFEVSQVVDQVKGVHCMIRKADFPGEL
ncbi:acetamidase/formamidase family protein [Streptomyces sp. TRM66268-LWL]|uniref:Acetamidase/formamidase family protein n=1 Tax=Streptomyces polyasparticus TaxID=2767826 RepID=A0ABR7SVR4_9ACTN|nr:acetamidase/formamidase family protein [Streptomyces polyasparticus]MBC9718750.1 acetamidase/formamidase family protein [Streptomyces polyasparticus]